MLVINKYHNQIKILLAFFIIATTFFSCDNNKENFHLDLFKDIPTDIDGGACYYSTTDKDFKQKEYIFINDFGNLAYISVNKTFIKLNLTKQDSLLKQDNLWSNGHQYTYSNENYEVIITLANIKAKGLNTSVAKGTIIVKQKGETIATETFVGECGC
jgi:hypothetical protein